MNISESNKSVNWILNNSSSPTNHAKLIKQNELLVQESARPRKNELKKVRSISKPIQSQIL